LKSLQSNPSIQKFVSTLKRFLFASSEELESLQDLSASEKMKRLRSCFVHFCRSYIDLIIVSTCFHFLYHSIQGKYFYTAKAAKLVIQSLVATNSGQFTYAVSTGAILWGLKFSIQECFQKNQVHPVLVAYKKDEQFRLVSIFLILLFCLCLVLSRFQHFIYLIPSLVLATGSIGMMKAWDLKVGQAAFHLSIISSLNIIVPLILDSVWIRIKQSLVPVSSQMDVSLARDSTLKESQSLEEFLKECESRIPAFCRRYFSIFGIFRLHHSAVGFDFILCPINSFLVIPLALARKVADALNHAGWSLPKTLIMRHVGNLPTLFQFEIEKRIYSEVFRLDQYPFSEAQRALIKKEVKAFIANRTSGADLASSTVNVWIGVRWFGKAGLSPMEMGKVLAKSYSHEKAVSKFVFGKTVGSWYYRTFPVAPSRQEIIAGAIVGVAVISAATLTSGFLFDLLQSVFGVNERNFRKMSQNVISQLGSSP
jgi:hypothetical protein